MLHRRRPNPEDTEASAQWVIDDLKADRYNVKINWLTGYDAEPLSVCTVSGITTPAIPFPAGEVDNRAPRTRNRFASP